MNTYYWFAIFFGILAMIFVYFGLEDMPHYQCGICGRPCKNQKEVQECAKGDFKMKLGTEEHSFTSLEKHGHKFTASPI